MVVLAASEGMAQACACCDGTSTRELLGWSRDGKRLLVDYEAYQACERTSALEVWRVGAAAPEACFDRYGDPDKRIRCEEIDYGRTNQTPGRPGLARHFTGLRKALARSRIRVERKAEGGDPDARARFHVTVSVRTGGAWRPVWSSRDAGGPLYLDDLPIVRIVPSPDGRTGVLLLSGHDRQPGIGSYPTELYWVDLAR
jgi:hypothetical protein